MEKNVEKLFRHGTRSLVQNGYNLLDKSSKRTFVNGYMRAGGLNIHISATSDSLETVFGAKKPEKSLFFSSNI